MRPLKSFIDDFWFFNLMTLYPVLLFLRGERFGFKQFDAFFIKVQGKRMEHFVQSSQKRAFFFVGKRAPDVSDRDVREVIREVELRIELRNQPVPTSSQGIVQRNIEKQGDGRSNGTAARVHDFRKPVGALE